MIGSVVKKGIGGLGGALMGGAGLIAGGLISSTGAGKYVAGAAAIGAGAMKFSSGGGSNTIAEKNLSSKSAPSEVEEAEVTILDKILKETGILAEVVQGQKIPESTKRELQLDKDKWHKKLINAFKSIKFSDGDKEKKKSWLDTLKNIFKALPIGLRQILKGGAFIAAYKMAKKFIKALGRFALRMLLVFASPAMIAVVAAFLIMTNWKAIKLRIRRTMYGIKKWLKDKLSYIGMGDLVTLGQNPDTAMDANEFADTPILAPEEEPTFTLPFIQGEPGIEPTAPGEFIEYESIDAFGGEGEDVGKILFTDPEAEAMDTFGLDEDKDDIVEEIRGTLAANLAGDITTAPVPEPEPEPEPFVPLVTRRRLAEFNTDGSLEQEIYAKTKRNNEAYNLINDFIHGEVKGSRNIAKAKLKEYLAAGYGLEHSYLSDLNKTGGYDASINRGLDKTYGVGTEARQSALDAGIGGVTSYGPSPQTTPQTTSYNQGQQYTKPKKEGGGQLTGLMGTHLHTAPKSTGLGWLDKLYQKDADMRYEKAFMKKEVKSDWVLSEEKLAPKVVVLNNETDTSKTMKKSSTSTKVMTPGFSVTNSSSVAVESAK